MSAPNQPFRANSAGFLSNHLARLFTQALAQALQPLGLAVAQFMVLLELWSEDGLTQRDLLLRLDVEQGTLTNTLNRMERDRLIYRRPHSRDGRAQTIHATAHALGLRTASIDAAESVNRAARAALTLKEYEMMIDLMTRVVATVRSQRKAASTLSGHSVVT